MAYTSHYQLADDVILHLDSIIGTIADPFLVSRYVGFVSVMAVTVYELAIKEIFIEFSTKKHKVFGDFTKNYFDRINGRILIPDLQDAIKKFGGDYKKKFISKIESAEIYNLRKNGISVKASYTNVISWRHQFAHNGQVPNNATFDEVKNSYKNGKIVIECLEKAMKK